MFRTAASPVTIVRKALGRLRGTSGAAPILGGTPWGGPEDSPVTLAMVCGTGFNIDVPDAACTIRLGFCRGFAEVGLRYRLVAVQHVEDVVPQLARPIVFLTAYDYHWMSSRGRRLLRDVPHIVWVNPWFSGLEQLYAAQELPDPRLPERVVRRMLESGPRFVWAPVPPSCLRFYESWQARGLRLEAIPLACDTTRYYRDESDERYAEVEMAFVGGYRQYKNKQYEKYLKPYEDRLWVYGYDHWPYSGYRGLLPNDCERVLYQNAALCPALSEPHAEVMGDIVERAFKVMGSGGLAVTDVIPFYRELFCTDELLVPHDVAEYHEMVQAALAEPDTNRRYRERGYAAVLARHTYAHRARHILHLLGMRDGRPEVAGTAAVSGRG